MDRGVEYYRIVDVLRAQLASVEGWCTPEKALKLVALVLDTRATSILEIGVFGGSSLLPMALAAKVTGGHVVGIDPWKNDASLEGMNSAENKAWWSALNLDEIHASCRRHVEEWGVGDVVELIRTRSDDASTLSRFDDESLDLIHIDGNHSEEQAYYDAVTYLPKLKSNGHCVFDDIWWTEADKVTTRRAVEHVLSLCERVEVVGDCLIAQKR